MAKFLLAILSIAIAANASEHGEIDILARTINFAIFAVLIYWLTAGFFKQFFGDRTKSIAQAFERAQDKAKDARSAREKAEEALKEAKASAEAILRLAREEATILADRIAVKTEEEIKALHRIKDESKVVAENKMIRVVVAGTMGEILGADDVLNDQDAIVENLRKRVA